MEYRLVQFLHRNLVWHFSPKRFSSPDIDQRVLGDISACLDRSVGKFVSQGVTSLTRGSVSCLGDARLGIEFPCYCASETVWNWSSVYQNMPNVILPKLKCPKCSYGVYIRWMSTTAGILNFWIFELEKPLSESAQFYSAACLELLMDASCIVLCQLCIGCFLFVDFWHCLDSVCSLDPPSRQDSEMLR